MCFKVRLCLHDLAVSVFSKPESWNAYLSIALSMYFETKAVPLCGAPATACVCWPSVLSGGASSGRRPPAPPHADAGPAVDAARRHRLAPAGAHLATDVGLVNVGALA